MNQTDPTTQSVDFIQRVVCDAVKSFRCPLSHQVPIRFNADRVDVVRGHIRNRPMPRFTLSECLLCLLQLQNCSQLGRHCCHQFHQMLIDRLRLKHEKNQHSHHCSSSQDGNC